MASKSRPEGTPVDVDPVDELAVAGDGLAGDVAGDDQGDDVIEATVISGPGVVGAEIARRDDTGAQVEGYVAANHPAMVTLNNWLAERVAVGNDADMAVAEIIAQVLSAESVDEVLADHAAMGMRELIDVPIVIHTAKPLKSAYEANAPWFFYLDVERLDTKERIGVTTGAQTVIAQLVRVAMLDGYPFTCKPINATKKPTANGYWPYRLTGLKTPAAPAA